MVLYFESQLIEIRERKLNPYSWKGFIDAVYKGTSAEGKYKPIYFAENLSELEDREKSNIKFISSRRKTFWL